MLTYIAHSCLVDPEDAQRSHLRHHWIGHFLAAASAEYMRCPPRYACNAIEGWYAAILSLGLETQTRPSTRCIYDGFCQLIIDSIYQSSWLRDNLFMPITIDVCSYLFGGARTHSQRPLRTWTMLTNR